jgi:hypothetical protein
MYQNPQVIYTVGWPFSFLCVQLIPLVFLVQTNRNSDSSGVVVVVIIDDRKIGKIGVGVSTTEDRQGYGIDRNR